MCIELYPITLSECMTATSAQQDADQKLRDELVAELKAKVDANLYNVPGDAIARRMLRCDQCGRTARTPGYDDRANRLGLIFLEEFPNFPCLCLYCSDKADKVALYPLGAYIFRPEELAAAA